MRAFYRKICAVLCICVFLAGGAPFCAADDVMQVESYFSGRESVSGLVDIPGRGMTRYYAQNDELWGKLIYESAGTSSSRPFRDSGCAPSAVAMAVASLIPEGDLPLIAGAARYPYSLCICSVNYKRCICGRSRYILTSQRDFARFLPLVFADYATGNNTGGYLSRSNQVGTATGFIQGIAACYGLTYHFTLDYDEMLSALVDQNQAVIALAGRGGVFTQTGHYVFIASADEKNLYILDPLCRSDYHTKNSKKLLLLQPGLVGIRHEDHGIAQFNNYCIFKKE